MSIGLLTPDCFWNPDLFPGPGPSASLFPGWNSCHSHLLPLGARGSLHDGKPDIYQFQCVRFSGHSNVYLYGEYAGGRRHRQSPL